jgi:segregation and condensation protein A
MTPETSAETAGGIGLRGARNAPLAIVRGQPVTELPADLYIPPEQYIRYIDLMVVVKLELAAEYLVMAAVLAEIKSRMLLPKPAPNDDEDADPRADLMRRLQEYERYKRAAEEGLFRGAGAGAIIFTSPCTARALIGA